MDLLALGAHPDDVEVHVGGLMALAARAGLRTGILDLTAGELGTRGDAVTRKAEAQEAARILGAARHNLQLPDGRFGEDEAVRLGLMEAFRELRPRVILLPAPDDRHPDHGRAHRLGREAAFYSGLARYPCPGVPFRPQAVAWVGGENPGVPDLVVDVSAVWEQRMAAFDAFGSQFHPDPALPPTRIASPAFRRGIEGRAMHWGSLVGTPWAEALWCPKPIPPALLDLLSKLPRTQDPGPKTP